MTQNIPKLRFPEFSGEWEAKKLGDLAQTVSGLTYSPKDIREEGVLVLRSSNIKKGRLAFDDSVFVKKSIRYNQLNKGDLLICVRNGSQALIGKNVYIDIELKNTTHGAFMTVIRSDESKFISQLFQTDQYYGQVSADLGARINSINNSQLLKYKFYFPGKNEQEKITRFLTVFDERVTTIDKKVELLQQYKKGLTQKIFTQKLRFKDDDGQAYPNWQEKKLGNVFEERQERGGAHRAMLSVTIKNGVVPFNSIERKDNSSGDKSSYKQVEPGDIAYNSMRMWQGASGVVPYSGIVSPAYTVLRTRVGNLSAFWAYYFKLPRVIFTFERYSQGLTSDTWNLKYNQLSEIMLVVPSEQEQKKIADFLVCLDDKINLEKAKLEQAKLFKKSLLQRMFV